MRRLLLLALKIGVSLALVAYLVADVQREDPATFTALATQPKDWPLLMAAWFLFLAALLLGVVRWYLFVRTAGLRYRFTEAVRLTILAYMLDFLALGAAAADVFKAVYLARQQPGGRARALATVIVDRVVGLFALLLSTSVGVVALGLHGAPGGLGVLSQGALAVTAVAALGLFAVMLPGMPYAALVRGLRTLPYVGQPLRRLVEALAEFRRRVDVLLLAIGVSVAILACNATGFYLIARGLPGTEPTLAQHFVIVPLALLSGVLPLPGDTLGVLDYAMNTLAGAITGGHVAASYGLLVVMTFRVVGITMTSVGLVFYLTSRGEVREAIEEAAAQ